MHESSTWYKVVVPLKLSNCYSKNRLNRNRYLYHLIASKICSFFPSILLIKMPYISISIWCDDRQWNDLCFKVIRRSVVTKLSNFYQLNGEKKTPISFMCTFLVMICHKQNVVITILIKCENDFFIWFI